MANNTLPTSMNIGIALFAESLLLCSYFVDVQSLINEHISDLHPILHNNHDMPVFHFQLFHVNSVDLNLRAS